MGRVHIITDSSARFHQKGSIREYDITIIPNTIHIKEKIYLSDVDIDSDDLINRIQSGCPMPVVTGPSIDDFKALFNDITSFADEVLVITHSSQLSDAYENAMKARAAFLGRKAISVIDSETASGALGLLVEKAARDARRGMTLHEVVTRARKNIPHLYTAFYVDRLDYIQSAGLIDKTAMIIGMMGTLKPLISIEDGRLQIIGKSNNFESANEKLVEYALEFLAIDKICAMVGASMSVEALMLLRSSIEAEFSHTYFPLLTLDPLMISLLGPSAIGLGILERDEY